MLENKYVNSIKKDEIDQKLIFKTKGLSQVLNKAAPRTYWLQCLNFC